ncbi:MAG: hypothetical protein ACREQ7_07155 [Candidatus Binatia bacterium]
MCRYFGSGESVFSLQARPAEEPRTRRVHCVRCGRR